MALENGLKPSILGFKGVGFGRSLPSSFGFGNCVLGDGINDYLSVPEFTGDAFGSPFNSDFSIEYFIEGNVVNRAIFGILTTDGGRLNIYGQTSTTIRFSVSGGTFNSINSDFTVSDTLKQAIAIVSGGTPRYNNYYVNSSLVSSFLRLADTNNPNITDLRLLSLSGFGYYLNKKVDEFRLYNRLVSLSELQINYNNGIGANPSNTTGLLLWFDFEKAEVATDLYPSGLPTGWLSTDWGIRNKAAQDSWTKKYHAKAVNMTNNATLGGVLQAW